MGWCITNAMNRNYRDGEEQGAMGDDEREKNSMKQSETEAHELYDIATSQAFFLFFLSD